MKSVANVRGAGLRWQSRKLWAALALMTIGLFGVGSSRPAIAGELEVEIDLTGWQTFDFVHEPGNTFIDLILSNPTSAPLLITGARWENLSFVAEGQAFREDLIIALSTSALSDDEGTYWDVRVLTDAPGPGTVPPFSGVFGVDGETLFDSGPFLLLADNVLHVQVYSYFAENFDDDDVSLREHFINSGRLFVTYSAVPEPSSMLLLGCAAAGGIGWGVRRRGQRRRQSVAA